MIPSLRSHPSHPQQPVSPPWTRDVGGNGCRSCGRLRQSLGGSPLLQTESGSLSFGTADPPRAAPHPVSRRRSCLRLLSRCSSRDDSDFHWLISCMCARTSAAWLRPHVDAQRKSKVARQQPQRVAPGQILRSRSHRDRVHLFSLAQAGSSTSMRRRANALREGHRSSQSLRSGPDRATFPK